MPFCNAASVRPPWTNKAAVGISLLAPALGGGLKPWAQGILLILMAILICLHPPRRSLGRIFNLILLCILLLALLAFLPAAWFSTPAWRDSFEKDFGVALPAILSPQPWLTAESCVLLLAGILWLYYLAAEPAPLAERRRLAVIFSNGIIVLAAISMVAWFLHWTIPFWHSQKNFGCFPNRNQMGNLLALGGIMTLACIYEDYRAGNRRGILRIAGMLAILAALIINYSRAGPILFFAGAFAWLIWLSFASRGTRRVGLGISALLLLVSVFFLFGGRTLERLFSSKETSIEITGNLRWRMHQDVFSMVKASPWCGTGAGNFAAIFPLYREASASEETNASQSQAIHPESDWLWLGAELGALAPILFAAGFIFLLRTVFHVGHQTAHMLRAAALIGVCMFILHSFVDVSGHRMGTLWPAIFLLSLALPESCDQKTSIRLVILFRCLATVIGLVGFVWLVSDIRQIPIPGSPGVMQMILEAERANQSRRFADAIQLTTQGLRWAPLRWEFYYQRAVARVSSSTPVSLVPLEAGLALEDFRRARFLQPRLVVVRLREGELWMNQEPHLALTVWQEALQVSRNMAPGVFSDMLRKGKSITSVRNGLHEMAGNDPALLLIFLEQATPAEFQTDLQRLLARDPSLKSLSPLQREGLSRIWAQHGDKAELVKKIRENEAWLRTGWMRVAQYDADQNEFRAACELAQRFTEPPSVPELPSQKPLVELKRDFLLHPDDVARGVVLFQAQTRTGDWDAELHTLIQLTTSPQCPAWLYYLEAESWMEKQQWQNAWKAWRNYSNYSGG